jgi:cytochrome c peroxidase
LARNSPALVNVAYNATLTWANPALTELERQIVIPLFAEFPVEMGVTGHEEEVLARFRGNERYKQLFAAAYPAETDPINYHNVVGALASFVRSLVSGHSTYDRYLAGDKNALPPEAMRGMELFFSERFECHHCHIGFNFSAATVHANSTFSASTFQNNGLYDLDGKGAYPRGNRGLYEITGEPNDMGRFRPPSLRNVALTAPYMHDGSIGTLKAVIRHYAAGGRVIESGPNKGDGRRNPYKSPLVSGFTITDQEVTDLVAFLDSLTDTEFVANPKYANPYAATADR